MGEEAKRYAVVTGANKGIGYGICKKLVLSGVVVVLTARNEKRGLEAVERLKKEIGLNDLVVFHQLDVDDSTSVATLAFFIKTMFGKLDILVNNAGVSGGKILNGDALIRKSAGRANDVFAQLSVQDVSIKGSKKSNASAAIGPVLDPLHWRLSIVRHNLMPFAFHARKRERNGANIDWKEVGYETYELAEKCLKTNFYGVERVTEALLPLLHLSTSPTIVNISSRAGLLKNISNEYAGKVFNDIDNLTKEKIDEVLKEFEKDYKKGLLEIKGWPTFASAYSMSKAALNAYTRIMAKKYPHFQINSVCPGFVKTDINQNTGILSIDEGVETPVMLALLPSSGVSGCFFTKGEVIDF